MNWKLCLCSAPSTQWWANIMPTLLLMLHQTNKSLHSILPSHMNIALTHCWWVIIWAQSHFSQVLKGCHLNLCPRAYFLTHHCLFDCLWVGFSKKNCGGLGHGPGETPANLDRDRIHWHCQTEYFSSTQKLFNKLSWIIVKGQLNVGVALQG